jgi:hypothetical protein
MCMQNIIDTHYYGKNCIWFKHLVHLLLFILTCSVFSSIFTNIIHSIHTTFYVLHRCICIVYSCVVTYLHISYCIDAFINVQVSTHIKQCTCTYVGTCVIYVCMHASVACVCTVCNCH